MIDYSDTKFAHPKPRVKALEREDKRRVLERRDKAENKKVKLRSGGRCEVIQRVEFQDTDGVIVVLDDRCGRVSAPGVHHLIGGVGRRNRGKSILAEHKLDVCKTCHELITGVLGGGKVLQPIAADMDAASIRFRRVR